MQSLFQLHPKLRTDTFSAGDLPLCRVLLMNDSRFPWLILVPRKPDLREIYDVSSAHYSEVMNEVRDVAEKFSQHMGARKMNVAALGNVVPQLHIHIIARFENDSAWPNPVWSAAGSATPYAQKDSDSLIQALVQLLSLAPTAD